MMDYLENVSKKGFKVFSGFVFDLFLQIIFLIQWDQIVMDLPAYRVKCLLKNNAIGKYLQLYLIFILKID